MTSDHVATESLPSALEVIEDTIGDLVTGIPAPVRKNAIKAFTRLCTVAIEYPASLIESAISERRAESAARIRLTEVSATQISEQMATNPEYARAAVKKFGQKILRERINVDKIVQAASEELGKDPTANESQSADQSASIDEDWLSVFENEASNISSEEMKATFGRILAGEIRKPSSFTIRTIKIVAQLDKGAASLFSRFCSLATSMGVGGLNIDTRVVSLGQAGDNSLQDFGLNFANLNILSEHGLILPQYDTYGDWQFAVIVDGKVALPLSFQGRKWALAPRSPITSRTQYRVTGLMLSRVGIELLPIVQTSPDPQYELALKNYFEGLGYTLIEMN